ncbi:MAG: ABC transporter permease [Bacteroidales bacterium]
MKNRNRTSRLIFLFLSGIALLFIISPIISLYFSSSLDKIFESAADPEVSQSIITSLVIAAATTLIFAVFAIPLAYLLARHDFKGKNLLLGFIDLPIVLPHSAAGIAVLGLITRDSLLGRLADSIGLNLIGSPFAIGLAMAFVSLPFLINSAKDGFEAVPKRLEQSAATLGASPFQSFKTIALPLAKPSIISGLVLMFARGMSEFGAVIIVAYHPMTAPVLIFDRFNSFGLSYARPISIIFVSVCVLVFILLRLLGQKKTSRKN